MLKQIMTISITVLCTIGIFFAACIFIPRLIDKNDTTSTAAEAQISVTPVVHTFSDPELNSCISKEVIVYTPDGFWDELKERYFPTPDRVNLTVDEAKLRSLLEAMNEQLSIDTETTTLADERTLLVTVGRQLNIDEIISAAHLREDIDLSDYDDPTPRISDRIVHKYDGWYVDYPLFGSRYTIPAGALSISSDNTALRLDLTFLDGLTAELAGLYQSAVQEEIDFQGKHLVFHDQGTVVRSLDTVAEFEYLKGTLLACSLENTRTPAVKDESPLNGDFKIFLDIDAQHLWLTHGNDTSNIIMESDVVTGDLKTSHNTPFGVFFVSEAIPGKYLQPEPGGKKTWVDRWMRLTNSGVGLHDAKWRKKFGGTLYYTDGSHGCINLPKQFAFDLFQYVSRGTRVYIYNSSFYTPIAVPEETTPTDLNAAATDPNAAADFNAAAELPDTGSVDTVSSAAVENIGT